MTRRLPILLLLALTSALAQAPAAKPPDTVTANAKIAPAPAGYKFADQTLVYDAEWRLWRAGTASLRLDAINNEERITGSAESGGVVSLLYAVHDRFESFLDAKTLCSRQLTKDTEEGSRKRHSALHFDYARGKAVFDEKDLKKGREKHVENDIPACASDVVSGIFYVGTLPLVPNATYTFPLNDGAKTVEVKVNVEGKEKIKTPAGEFNTIRVQPESSVWMMKNRGKVWIWYTDDAAHTPVQMKAKMFWGTLTFRLLRVEKR
jgi:hypothetical protein